MTREDAKLKPCPFCGANVSMTYNTGESAFCIWHDGAECVLEEPFKIDVARAKSFAEAAEAWNRRVKQ